MNYLKLLSFLLCFMVLANCADSETKEGKKWFKGNLHTHSYWSDGDDFPEMILDWYKTRGYHFVALSEHNIIADIDKWKRISDDSVYQKAFKNYLQKYGEDWVNYRMDSGRLEVKLKTYNEYKNLIEAKDEFLVIKSEEITTGYNDHPIHLNATNIQHKIEPRGGGSVLEVLQNNIDAVNQQREATGIPMIPHINHPNYYYGVSLEDMKALKGERFFEIYNGHPMVHNFGDEDHISTEEMWDLINISYLKAGKPIMYGLATDDSHSYHNKGSEWSNAGRGWIMVQADSLKPGSMINAMEKGHFYASTGVTLQEVDFKNNNLSIKVEPEKGIEYTFSFMGCKKGKIKPEVFAEVNDVRAKFEITNDIQFVRCKITSTKLQDNPIENSLYEMAWTQPILNELN